MRIKRDIPGLVDQFGDFLFQCGSPWVGCDFDCFQTTYIGIFFPRIRLFCVGLVLFPGMARHQGFNRKRFGICESDRGTQPETHYFYGPQYHREHLCSGLRRQTGGGDGLLHLSRPSPGIVQGWGFFNPNLEKITALRPDLIILQGKHEKMDGFCRAKKIPALHVAMDSLDTIYGGIVALGDALGASRQARELNHAIRQELEAVCGAVSGFPRKRVFISLGRAMGSMANLYTVGGSSF
jgi:hypothetical protein